MPELTPEGRKTIEQIAAKFDVPADAAIHLLNALARGGGRQAQFSHPGLGGMGQWQQGGMTMVGDMFNNALKAQVDSIASKLSAALEEGGIFKPTAEEAEGASSSSVSVSFSSSGHSDTGWPAELGSASSVGAQNDLQYAVFPATRRLAIRKGGTLSVYDTGDHVITGFGQQQGGDQTLTFTSQHGTVRLSTLKRVDGTAGDAPAAAPAATPEPAAEKPMETAPAPATPPASASGEPASDDDTIFARIEKLADLHAKGILSDSEFTDKKAELLARL